MLELLLTHRRAPLTEATRSVSFDTESPREEGTVSIDATPDSEQPLSARLIASAEAETTAILMSDARVISHSSKAAIEPTKKILARENFGVTSENYGVGPPSGGPGF